MVSIVSVTGLTDTRTAFIDSGRFVGLEEKGRVCGRSQMHQVKMIATLGRF